MNTARAGVAVASLAVVSGAASADLATFNDLVLGTEYVVGDTFVSDGVGFEILDLRPGWMFSSHAHVDDNLMSGGDQLDIGLNNVRLELILPFTSVPSVTVFFGQYGGENNLFVNGEMLTSGNVFAFDGMNIGGATVEVVDLGAGTLGRLTVTGDIQSFGISGQELWVDDLRFAIPTPSALTLLACGGLVATRRRR